MSANSVALASQCPRSGATISEDQVDGSWVKQGPCECGRQHVAAERVEGQWVIRAHNRPVEMTDLGEKWAGKLADVLLAQPFPARGAEDESDNFWLMAATRAKVPAPVNAVRRRAVFLAEVAELEREQHLASLDAEHQHALVVEQAIRAAAENRFELESAF